MTMTPMRRHVQPTYAMLRSLEGSTVTVVASVLDGYGIVPLTLECLSCPIAWSGSVTYSVRLTGPVEARLVPGRYVAQHGDLVFVLSLFEVAHDVRTVHYEAYLS
jgi:hypothetical protein